MVLSTVPDQSSIEERIAACEIKARWCDDNGFPEDARQHRAYVAQLRRRYA